MRVRLFTTENNHCTFFQAVKGCQDLGAISRGDPVVSYPPRYTARGVAVTAYLTSLSRMPDEELYVDVPALYTEVAAMSAQSRTAGIEEPPIYFVVYEEDSPLRSEIVTDPLKAIKLLEVYNTREGRNAIPYY